MGVMLKVLESVDPELTWEVAVIVTDVFAGTVNGAV
jgi:hypothetical protein